MSGNGVLRRIFDLIECKLTNNGENYIARSFIICAFTKHYWRDKTNGDMTGGMCSRHEGHEKCVQILVGKSEGKPPHERPEW
jgi:hypothetical protein